MKSPLSLSTWSRRVVVAMLFLITNEKLLLLDFCFISDAVVRKHETCDPCTQVHTRIQSNLESAEM